MPLPQDRASICELKSLCICILSIFCNQVMASLKIPSTLFRRQYFEKFWEFIKKLTSYFLAKTTIYYEFHWILSRSGAVPLLISQRIPHKIIIIFNQIKFITTATLLLNIAQLYFYKAKMLKIGSNISKLSLWTLINQKLI